MIKKRIVHVVPTFALGGVQTGILYSLEELNKIYDYKVLVIGKVDDEWLKNLSPHLSSYIIRTGITGVFWGYFKAYKLLRSLQPELVISSLWKSVTLSAIYKFFNPRVYLLGFFHNAFSPHNIGGVFLKIMTKVQDSAIADSGETKAFLRNEYGIKNVDVIPYNLRL